MPWIDWGRVRIEGPGGSLEISVGPTGPDTNDFLRGFDAGRNEVLSVEIGRRGSWWSDSVSLHCVFDDNGLRWSIWSATGVPGDILRTAGDALLRVAPALIGALL